MKNTEATTLLARREALLGKPTPLFYREPVTIVRGEGVWLWDAEETRYLDLYNNVPCVGHANPHVVEAMHRQASTLNVHNRYLHEGILDYAERLLAHHHDGLTSAVFACSGTEANEIALKMARIATGGRGIICTGSAYHGNSEEVGRLNRAGQKSDPEIRSIPFPERYRPIIEDVGDDELSDRYLEEVSRAIDEFDASGVPFAGMLICPLFANEGLPDVPAGFVARATELVHAAGGLMISDEVQAGFCRSGEWWGYETAGALPDIVSMGKPMANGLPLSGVVASSDLVNRFREGTRYFNTFASSPLQAAAGAAVLDVLEQEDLKTNAASVGQYLRDGLERLQPRFEPMADVRGDGLFVGVEWVSDRKNRTADRSEAVEIVNRMKDKGFLFGNAGAFGNVLKLRPPLVFRHEHADLFLTAFEETLVERYGG